MTRSLSHRLRVLPRSSEQDDGPARLQGLDVALTPAASIRPTSYTDEVLDAAFTARVYGGELPFVAEGVFTTDNMVRPLTDWLPAGAVVARAHYSDLALAGVLAHVDSVTVLLRRRPNGVAWESAAGSPAALQPVAAHFVGLGVEESDEITRYAACYLTRGYVEYRQAKGQFTVWGEVRRNYPAATGQALDQLVRVVRPSDRGRLVVLHGAPGTGKTRFLQSLIREWRSWCSSIVVSDPERLFADSAYVEALLADDEAHRVCGVDDQADQEDRWRLLICEDAETYVGASAKREATGNLGKLLNVTDGLLGGSARVIVALTTNEALHTLHPAVTRPGRCLAQVDFVPFAEREAATWLGDDAAAPRGDCTLAELYARQSSTACIGGAPERTEPGNYL